MRYGLRLQSKWLKWRGLTRVRAQPINLRAQMGIRELNNLDAEVVTVSMPIKSDDQHQARLRRKAAFAYQPNIKPTNMQTDHRLEPLTKYGWANSMDDGTFHQAMRNVLLVAQFFGMMPVIGITSSHPTQLLFAWSSVRTLCTLAFIVLSVVDLMLASYKTLHGSITFNNIEPIIFRSAIIVVCVNALKLAQKWPALMVHWDEAECNLPPYVLQRDKSRMAQKIRRVAVVALILSIVEHILSLTAIVQDSRHCPASADSVKNFFLLSNDEIFYVLPYSILLALLGKVLNILSLFIWNYMDIFVMLVSIGLSSKFRQLNDNLVKFKGMHMPLSFWSEHRILYRNLCLLCERMDNAISLITMISFSNNLYFICVQLVKSLNKMPSLAHALHFYFSLLFLLGRTLAVSLYSAEINDESRKPLRVLRCVPKESWCMEVKRFSEEISSEVVALSGMKFFHLTRKLVLSVAGTVVTYELVLIQFREEGTIMWDCNRSEASAN